MKLNTKERHTGIEYLGLSGVSASCKDAVLKLLQFGDQITHAKILSCSKNHCLLLTVNNGDFVAIRSGFASGYPGEGPRTFSFVLKLLEAYGVEIDEYEVDRGVIDRVDESSLSVEDLSNLDVALPVRPSRWYSYIDDPPQNKQERAILWKQFPPVIPFAIIDSRLIDLAMTFFERPDDIIFVGYRRLEDILRKKAGVDEYGTKLISQAFLSDKAKLTWEGLGDSERTGRALLFNGAFLAYRNPRAHREMKHQLESCLMEFLLLNHLYVLERQAIVANESI